MTRPKAGSCGGASTANRSGTNPFLEMNHEADRGAGHSLHGLDLGDDQLLERINVIASNANNRVISAGNGGGGGNAWNLSQLLDNLGLPPHVNHDQYVGVAQRLPDRSTLPQPYSRSTGVTYTFAASRLSAGGSCDFCHARWPGSGSCHARRVPRRGGWPKRSRLRARCGLFRLRDRTEQPDPGRFGSPPWLTGHGTAHHSPTQPRR